MNRPDPAEVELSIQSSEPYYKPSEPKPSFPVCSRSNNLFCAASPVAPGVKLKGRWLDDDNKIDAFIEESQHAESQQSKRKRPFVTLIAGTGTGVGSELSVKETVLNGTEKGKEEDTYKGKILLSELGFHKKVFELIPTPHAIFAQFGTESRGPEAADQQAKGQNSGPEHDQHIIFRSPKSPVREIFCALRVTINNGRISMRCLIFDNFPNNHMNLVTDKSKHLDRLLNALGTESDDEHPPWLHPVTLIAAIIKECAWSSEVRQQNFNNTTLVTAVTAEDVSWEEGPKIPTRWVSNFSRSLVNVQLARTNVTFIQNAVHFQLNAWQKLKGLSDLYLHTFSPPLTLDDIHGIDSERWKTEKWENELNGLKEQFQVQSDTLQTLISHKDSQYSAILDIIALTFAPASIVLSIFSLPFITYLDERQWTVNLFTEVMVPCSLVPAVVGYIYLARDLLWNWNSDK